MEIDGKIIGKDCEPYIVAEMSANHNGKIENAFEIIKSAKENGAHAVKIQTYTADTITINHNSDEFILKSGLWQGRKLYDLYKEAHTPWEWHKEIFDYARKIGITVFSSPFDHTAVDFLEELNNPAYKIASPELIDIPLIQKVSKTGKPIILSTGMASSGEIEDAINEIRKFNIKDLIVLHCTAAYPAPIDEANLSTIREISKRFRVLSGLSDHTEGTFVASIACAMGACMIEKHFTIDRKRGGLDSSFSIEPQELKELVNVSKLAKKVLGTPAFEPTNSEQLVLKTRRSLYAIKDIKKGDKFESHNIKSIRPGNGMKPKYYNSIIGKKASVDISFGEALKESMIDDL